MADEIDSANETAAFNLSIALRNHKHSPIIATPQGYCLHCGVELGFPLRWCNAEHRDAWQAEQK
jgi:hypothetical protein